ncbi:MAG: DUF3667 domain-containing protein [Chitinophagales bacterium]|nr:DUF3667 domain-containing protein [Chitinophagales bacterium]
MNIVCKNCNHHFKGHYCSNCGQTADTHRLNVHFLWQDIKKGIFHIDEGILYSFLQLFTRPGNSIREFIEGKRKNHFKPLSLVIVWATAYALLYHSNHLDFVKNLESEKLDMSQANDWVTTHFAWITLSTIPLYALVTFIVFKKEAYNFIEHLVLNAYLSAQRLSIHILLFPFTLYSNGTPNETKVTLSILLIDVSMAVWSYTQFFNKLPRGKAFLKAILSYAIILFLLFSLAFLITELIK